MKSSFYRATERKTHRKGLVSLRFDLFRAFFRAFFIFPMNYNSYLIDNQYVR